MLKNFCIIILIFYQIRSFEAMDISIKTNDDHLPFTSVCNCGTSPFGKTVCGQPPSIKSSNRIVGGHHAKLNEFPWMALIEINQNGTIKTCGGTLINTKFILTAAHCLIYGGVRVRSSQVTVKLGEHNRADTTESLYYQEFEVERIITHPNYDGDTLNNDIALLKLKKVPEFSKAIGPVCMPTNLKEFYVNYTGVVAGWGVRQEGSTQISDYLWVAEVRVLKNNDLACVSGGQDKDTPSLSKLCAIADGKDACDGDSGGPLITLDQNRCTLIGVISYGVGCARTGFAGIYTRVSHYLHWIHHHSKEGGCVEEEGKYYKNCDLTCTDVRNKTGLFYINGKHSFCYLGECYVTDGGDLCKTLNYPCN